MKAIGGNAIDMKRLRAVGLDARETVFRKGRCGGGVPGGVVGGLPADFPSSAPVSIDIIDVNQPGLIRGVARDVSGAVLPGVTVEVASPGAVRTAVTDRNGRFAVTTHRRAEHRSSPHPGFTAVQSIFDFDQRRAKWLSRCGLAPSRSRRRWLLSRE